jgi:hypothetical protein
MPGFRLELLIRGNERISSVMLEGFPSTRRVGADEQGIGSRGARVDP